MTINEAKQRLVTWCNSQVGYHEGYDGSNKYGADGDWDLKLYGFDASNVAWCSVFVDYAFIHCFGYDIGTKMTFQSPNGYALCQWDADAYKDNGHWYGEPEVGDQIFFYYGGAINHTGIVVTVDGSNISCIEGNYSDGVGRTYYNWRISSQIAGFGRPDWRLAAKEQDDDGEGDDQNPGDDETPSEPVDPPAERRYMPLKYMDGLNNPWSSVKAWQALMQCWGINVGSAGVDGEFYNDTLEATKEFQRRLGLPVTGEVDEECWKQAIWVG